VFISVVPFWLMYIYNHTIQKKPNKNKKKIEKNMGQIRAPNGQKGTT